MRILLRQPCHWLRSPWRRAGAAHRFVATSSTTPSTTPGTTPGTTPSTAFQRAIQHRNKAFSYTDVSSLTNSPVVEGRHHKFPCPLFRVQHGRPVVLRDYFVQIANDIPGYDICTDSGIALPLDGWLWKGPNGAAMRPNTFGFHEIVRNFHRARYIYRIQKGTPVPPGLVLIHEHAEQFSLQAAEPMLLTALNAKLTMFFHVHGERMSIPEFSNKYTLPWQAELNAMQAKHDPYIKLKIKSKVASKKRRQTEEKGDIVGRQSYERELEKMLKRTAKQTLKAQSAKPGKGKTEPAVAEAETALQENMEVAPVSTMETTGISETSSRPVLAVNEKLGEPEELDKATRDVPTDTKQTSPTQRVERRGRPKGSTKGTKQKSPMKPPGKRGRPKGSKQKVPSPPGDKQDKPKNTET